MQRWTRSNLRDNASESQSRAGMSNTHPTVFVVDDDRSVREGIVDLINSVGMKVQAFSSAEEFLRHKRPDTPACLVLDVRLPGPSGLDLQRRLCRSEQPIPIIFITGHGDIRSEEHTSELQSRF